MTSAKCTRSEGSNSIENKDVMKMLKLGVPEKAKSAMQLMGSMAEGHRRQPGARKEEDCKI